MSLEHAQQIMRSEGKVLAGKMHNPEMRSRMLVAELVLDLIEEIRWLRNDLNNLNQNRMVKQ
ncbi:MAG: hypothetical protein ACXV6K_08265 [Halobacteriota archaeon]